MSELLQSGQQPGASGRPPDPSGHPDADQLSAFMEHALPGHERDHVLAHLAVCPDCRETVALSLPPAEAPPALPARPGRKRWFPGWTVLVPAATALAAAAIFVVYTHRPPTGARNDRAQMALSQSAAPAPPPTQSAVSAVTVRSRQAPPARPELSLRQSVAPSASAAVPTGAQRVRPLPPEKKQALSFSAQPPQLSSPPAEASDETMRSRPEAGAAVGSGAGAAGSLGTGAAGSYGALAAPAPPAVAAAHPPSAPNAAPSAGKPAGFPIASAAVVSSGSAAQSIQVLNEAPIAAAPADTKSLDLVSNESQAPLLLNTLPSRLSVISSANYGARVLAIDAHNAVFLSADSGRHWEPVPIAWQGRAVKAGLVSQAPAYAPGALASGGNFAVFAGRNRSLAKEANASLTGTVTDPSGAAISGATVALTDAATSTAHTVKTGLDGRYLAGGLAPGAYNLEAQAPGFQVQNLHGIIVEAARPNVTNLSLNVGSASETVTVEAAKTESKVSTARFSSLAPPAALPPSPVFEITTDTGSRWTSTDGLTWKRD